MELIREAMKPGYMADPQRHASDEDEEDIEEDYNSPTYQLNDVLVTAVQEVVYQEFLDAGKVGKGPGQMTKNDIELEFEEVLMDALLPISKKMLPYVEGEEDEEESPTSGPPPSVGGLDW
tara:strand:+ start:261 stop:620 length:360 start_codon:yes stop_codon:yes gene_type:complete